MPWCIKTRTGGILRDSVMRHRGEAIDHAIAAYREDSNPLWLVMSRMEIWGYLKRLRGLSVVRVQAFQVVWEPSDVTNAGRLALAVLRGDHDAALALADLVLETYHAAK